MSTSVGKAGSRAQTSEEITGLESALQNVYAQLRERARAEWEQRQAGRRDPADASVSVHISALPKASQANPRLAFSAAEETRPGKKLSATRLRR